MRGANHESESYHVRDGADPRIAGGFCSSPHRTTRKLQRVAPHSHLGEEVPWESPLCLLRVVALRCIVSFS